MDERFFSLGHSGSQPVGNYFLGGNMAILGGNGGEGDEYGKKVIKKNIIKCAHSKYFHMVSISVHANLE